MDTILVVDDNKDLQNILSSILKEEGYSVLTADDGYEALNEIKVHFPDLVLLDIRLPEMDGLELLKRIKEIDKQIIVIMLTAYGDIKGAVSAMKLGAYDYITKPFDNEELVLNIRNSLKIGQLTKEVDFLRKKLEQKSAREIFLGESPPVKQVLNQVKMVASTNMTVIIQGESGTGKDLISQMIHQESMRKDKPFIAIDCGTIPETLVESELFGYEKGAFTGAGSRKEGKFELANEGTIFLDEITNLSENIQMKLLRIIEERKFQRLGGKKDIKVDVRLIVASNLDLTEVVRLGKFRNDLFHRINEFNIILPPLRERKDDISILANHFLYEANKELKKNISGFSPEVVKSLFDYHWPGNVRELRNVIKKAVLTSDSEYIKPKHLLLTNNIEEPQKFDYLEELDKGLSLHDISKKVVNNTERKLIKRTLEKVAGNKSKAAKILKIDRMTLYSKIKEFQIE